MVRKFKEVIRDFKGGQQEALLRKLFLAAGGEQSGEENLRAILRDELVITLVYAMVKLVDSNGRFIPLKGMKSGSDFVKPNRNFPLVQPMVLSVPILDRLQQYFSGLTFASAEEFDHRVAELLEQIQAMKQMKGLLKGVHFPICLPQITLGDYDQTIEDVFLDAVKRSYETQFPGRRFINHRAGTDAGKVGIVEESRHGQIIKKMQNGPVVGIFFPNAMRGFSIPADRKLIEVCPEGFSLADATVTAVAMVAKPETLARDCNTSCLDCAANTWQSPEYSLCFYPFGDRLDFINVSLGAHERCSGGLLFVG